MNKQIPTVLPLLLTVLVLGMWPLSVQAAPFSPLDSSIVHEQARSGLAYKIHGRHCSRRRGHRHRWVCRENRKRRYRRRQYRDEQRSRYPYGNYPDYPTWADRAFTDAEERDGNGRN